MMKLAVLISGGGTTMLNLNREISAGRLPATIAQVIASRPCAGVERARSVGLPVCVERPRDHASLEAFSAAMFDRCRAVQADLVVLAGFLSKIIIPNDYLQGVINIHPSLIPAFCGAGMFGHHVHEAVLDRGCKVSGCTVHFCNNEYDAGPIILQRTVPVLDDDSPDSLAARVFEAECAALPEAIQLIAAGRVRLLNGRVFIEADIAPGGGLSTV